GAFGWTLFYLKSKDEKPPVRYATQQPFTTNIIKKTVATGKIVPRKEIEVKPQVSGIVEKLYVEPGDVVKKGDMIATVRIIPNMVSLNNAENRVKIAELNLQNAKKDFDRNKQLFDEGVIPGATFQAIELSYDNAKQELSAAKDNLQIIKKGATSRSGNTSNTNVRTTIGGMVLDVPIEEGNSVIESNTFNDGTTVATVADMNEMIFEGKVDESEVGKISPGMDLLMTIGAIEKESFGAKLEYISPKGMEENGAIQFEIRAAMTLKKDFFIRANYSANADIVLARVDSVLAINEGLIQFEGERAYVEVEVTDQVFEKKFIETGLSDGIKIEITSGLSKEDKIKNPNKQL
ncbi:efflux RND transporter periplasmic adaptor subunit, partial [bacterium]|nr:efflux RND transporter periplasmic adaptor subunit [bacterium]